MTETRYPPKYRTVVSKSAAYTATVADDVILCSGTFTVDLPAVSKTSGKQLEIKNIGTGVITVDASGAETIDGAATVVLSTRYDSVTLVSNSFTWYVI